MLSLCLYPSMTFYFPSFKRMVSCSFLVGMNEMQNMEDPKITMCLEVVKHVQSAIRVMPA